MLYSSRLGTLTIIEANVIHRILGTFVCYPVSSFEGRAIINAQRAVRIRYERIPFHWYAWWDFRGNRKEVGVKIQYTGDIANKRETQLREAVTDAPLLGYTVPVSKVSEEKYIRVVSRAQVFCEETD
jgi:hypothetical protein